MTLAESLRVTRIELRGSYLRQGWCGEGGGRGAWRGRQRLSLAVFFVDVVVGSKTVPPD
jgi:hypothetical protein